MLRSRLSSRLPVPPPPPPLPLPLICLLASSRRRARSTRANVGLSNMEGVRLGGPEFGSEVTSITALKMLNSRANTLAHTRTHTHARYAICGWFANTCARAPQIDDREIPAHTDSSRKVQQTLSRPFGIYDAVATAVRFWCGSRVLGMGDALQLHPTA